MFWRRLMTEVRTQRQQAEVVTVKCNIEKREMTASAWQDPSPGPRG